MNLIWNRHTRSTVLRLVQFLPIRRGGVMCVCWGGEQWGCNPRAIIEKIAEKEETLSKFQIYVAFKQPERFRDQLPVGVNAVEIGSLDYFRLLASSQFVISNTRLGGGLWWPFPKRRGQYYIQTMHGGHGLKKQELEVGESLGEDYVKFLYEDASRIDLMISDSRFWTEKARTIFAYPKGEILEVGLPRNDRLIREAKIEVSSKTRKYLIYCPTFRNNGRRDVYGFDIDRVVAALEQRFGGEWYIRVSSHPNMRSYYREVYDFSHPRLIDVGQEDLASLYLSSDAALTDYSSAGLEFALTNRPSFLLCRDLEDYDRGVYFDMKHLPFPYAETDDQLVHNILNFDNGKYLQDLERFNTEVIGLNETGHASETVVQWMLDASL